MSTHYNNVSQLVTGTPGTGTITLGAASVGAQTFGTATGGANATVDVFITDGTAWEVATNCTYTHSGTTLTRGTLESSSTGSAISLSSAAVVRVAAPASAGNAWDAKAGLTANSFTGLQTFDSSGLNLNGARVTGDSANIIAQRNGTAAQASRVYNTFTDASNGEWGAMRWNANVLEIGAYANGTGAVREISVSGSSAQLSGTAQVYVATAGAVRWIFNATGGGHEIAPNSNGSFDIGATSNRVRRIYTLRLGASIAAIPSALIEIAAGTATAGTAPLKLNSGTNLTTPENGAFEYNGTNLFFTRASAAREGVLTQSAVTTEALTADTSVTVNIGGTTYKLLAKA